VRIRALIVDDEVLARERLRKLLRHAADLEVMGECSNGADAIAVIRDQRPDLVFLDVQMPEISGLEVLRALPPELWPALIFVTAHDQYALEAFEIHALDYLLKPFTQARLLAAVERARQQLEARNLAGVNQQLAEWLKSARSEPAQLGRIAVKSGTQTLFIRVEVLDYVESVGNYALLHAKAEKHVLRETLTNLEGRLPSHLFLRISRSILVNLERVKGLESTPNGESLVVLQDGRQLVMTRGLKEIQERLQYPEGRVGLVR